MLSILISLSFVFVTNLTYSEEKVKCNDIRKYTERLACKAASAKKILGDKLKSSKDGANKLLKKVK